MYVISPERIKSLKVEYSMGMIKYLCYKSDYEDIGIN